MNEMRLNVGIIGLGEVAQLVHLPILSDLNDKYRIKTVADISPSLNEFIVNKYNISGSCISPSEILKDPDAMDTDEDGIVARLPAHTGPELEDVYGNDPAGFSQALYPF